jgi:hypothetical protein
MLDTYMRTALTHILLDGGPLQDTWASLWLVEATKARPPANQGLCDPASLSAGCVFSPLCLTAP